MLLRQVRNMARGIVPPRYRAAVKFSLVNPVRALPHCGDGVECPCCGGRFRRFKPNPRDGRPDAMCPRCEAVERHRLLTHFLQHRTGLFSAPLRVIDFAPMYGMMRRFKSLPNLDYLAVDLSLAWVDRRVDITGLPFPDQSFDAIICYHVLEHVPDHLRGMRELFRVLRPGGWGVIQVPVDMNREETLEDPAIVTPEDRLRVYGHADHKRLYGRDYSAMLQSAGFDVEIIPYLDSFSEGEKRRLGLVQHGGFSDDNHIFLSTRP